MLNEQITEMLSHDEKMIVEPCIKLIEATSPRGARFWFGTPSDISIGDVNLQDHADIIYSAYLLGITEQLSSIAAQAYQNMLAQACLYARPNLKPIADKVPNAHLTAYLLGAARILQLRELSRMPPALFEGWQVHQIVDKSNVPRWPRIWTHHSWRVSHWIGGGPSILLQLAQSPHLSSIDEDFVARVLKASADNIIDPATGLLRPYKSNFLHKIFNALYRIRHDPSIGEVGGVVHILWIFHALNVEYVASEHLYCEAMHHLKNLPFMETVPYCLDFDIVQLARTAKSNDVGKIGDLHNRANKYRRDLCNFFLGGIPHEYTLHKLPGALATLHESSLIVGDFRVPGIGITPVDIIRNAYWI